MGVAARRDPDPLVLVVDDEVSVRQALERALRLEGFAVSTASGGRAALEEVVLRPPAVVVLDVMMPDLDGVSVVRRLRASGIDVPVCILSARDEVSDRVAGLQAGADDYLVKPFALAELTARLHALLRRRGSDGAGALVAGHLVVDPRRHFATRGGRSLQPTRREFELLEAFARHPGQVLSREQLLEQVWGYAFEVDTPFARGAGATAAGTGLGLAIVAQQVALHGGTLRPDDSGLGGLGVHVALPATAGSARDGR